MSYAVGYDHNWKRWIGYGVPAFCDHPGCGEEIDRGLAHVCAEQEPYGGEHGCGLHFCGAHLAGKHTEEGDFVSNCCERCRADAEPFMPTNDTREWIEHMLSDESWQQWRDQNANEVNKLRELLSTAA